MSRIGSRPRVLFLRFAPWMIFRNNHPHDLMWPCSHLYGRGIAERDGWQGDLLDLHVEPLDHDQIVERINEHDYDLVLIDTMTPTMAFAREVAVAVKTSQPNTMIWGIGQHASERPEDLLYDGSAYSGVLLGEWEAVLPQLLANSGQSSVPHSVTWEDALVTHGGKVEVPDCDALPHISPAGLRLERYQLRSAAIPKFGRVRWGFLLTSRGCPYPCTFCSATLRQSYGRGYRPHSAERVVDDMIRIHRDFGVNAYYMIDDVFSLNKKRVMAICDGLIKANLPISFVIQTRGDLVDQEMCDHLYRAGCVGVKMGVESGVPRILKIIRKNSTRKQMEAAAKAVNSTGMSLTAYYMLGHPTETREEMDETYRFARELDADMIQVGFHTPYPGSQSYADYQDQVHDLSELNHYETQHVNLSQVSSEDLESLQRKFYLRYYFHPRTMARYIRNRALYNFTDPAEWKLAALALRYLLLDRGRVGTSDRQPKPKMAVQRPVVPVRIAPRASK